MTDTARNEPISIALALLDRHWPAVAALTDCPGAETLARLETDRRYLIGRLQQALTTLLAADLPPMDPQTTLLSQAIADALDWRLHTGRPCALCGDSLCGECSADWDQADRYHELARALGAMGDRPLSPRPSRDRG
jgi:hypothetical protein